ncbi:MAG: esterase/lipase [Gammaproteobacteria bacterium]|nr:esterase/lipase [Gammaproteobacteria bacterium]
MSSGDRREFLGLGGSLLLTGASAQAEQRAVKHSARLPSEGLHDSWVKAPRIPLWPGDPPGGGGFTPQPRPGDWSPLFINNVVKPDLRVFRPSHSNGHALLVVPGGAYWFISSGNEGVEAARRMNELGVSVFVLTYRLPGEGWQGRADVPLQDAQRAMRVIRANATRFGIDPDKLSVLGFSAGGHLAATLATQHSESTYTGVDAADRLSARPLAAGLVYPVVTMERPWTHAQSRSLLLGDSPTDAEVQRRSAERHVDADTPPVFMVHCFDDGAVPIENSLGLMNAMREAQRPVEAHLFQEGGHGFGVGHPNTPSAHWTAVFASWVSRVG